jgi:sugar diacid utilization regulator
MYLIFLINLYHSFLYRKKHVVLTNFQSLQKGQRRRTIRYLLHSYSFETLHLLFNGNRSVVVLLMRTTKFGFLQPKLFCSMYKHMTVCKQRSSTSAKFIFCSDISLNMLLLIKITLTVSSI